MGKEHLSVIYVIPKCFYLYNYTRLISVVNCIFISSSSRCSFIKSIKRSCTKLKHSGSVIGLSKLLLINIGLPIAILFILLYW